MWSVRVHSKSVAQTCKLITSRPLNGFLGTYARLSVLQLVHLSFNQVVGQCTIGATLKAGAIDHVQVNSWLIKQVCLLGHVDREGFQKGIIFLLHQRSCKLYLQVKE
jgi:hypothetical protein